MTIHPDTRLGSVSLAVSNLPRALNYYQETIGLQLLTQQAAEAALGAAGNKLLTLIEQPNGRRFPQAPGLYHLALLLPTRAALGSALRHLAEVKVPLGMSDHGVSEALYLSDPDGNGIELYRDRPRDQWPRTSTGDIALFNKSLDVEGILAAAEKWSGLPASTRLGHMHLQVSDVAQAEAFYVDLLGFELVSRWGNSARFVGAGGYHHHLGLNTWHSAGAAPVVQPALGLRSFEICLPAAGWAALKARLVSAAYPFTIPADEQTLGLADPFSNQLIIYAT